MENVAKEVPIIELMHHDMLNIGGQLFLPILVVAAKRDIERDDALNRTFIDRPVAISSTCGGESMKECFFTLFRRALEKIAPCAWEDRLEIRTCLVDTGLADLEHEMMLEPVTILRHAPWQVAREQSARHLQHLVAEMARQEWNMLA